MKTAKDCFELCRTCLVVKTCFDICPEVDKLLTDLKKVKEEEMKNYMKENRWNERI